MACPEVLLVFEYDGLFDWEAVRIGDAWTTSAIEWIRDLADRLTQNSMNPEGQSLMVHSGPRNCSCLYCFRCPCTLSFVRAGSTQAVVSNLVLSAAYDNT